MTDTLISKTQVTLKMIIDAGVLPSGSKLVCSNPNVQGILNDDGSITVYEGDKEKVFEYLSGAARYIEKISLNGWLYWSVEINGARYSIDNFRDQYLKIQKTA